jgi:hypothetical protein
MQEKPLINGLHPATQMVAGRQYRLTLRCDPRIAAVKRSAQIHLGGTHPANAAQTFAVEAMYLKMEAADGGAHFVHLAALNGEKMLLPLDFITAVKIKSHPHLRHD